MGKIVFTSAAQNDLIEAGAFYASIRPLQGNRFANAVDQAIAMLSHNPRIGHPTFFDCRKLRLHRLPYPFVYSVEKRDEVVIHALVHERRKPTHWHSRIST